MKTMRILAAVLAIGALGGCSSTPRMNYKSSPRTITLRTEPAGATVKQLQPFGQATLDWGTTPLIEKEVPILTDVDFENVTLLERNEAIEYAGNFVVLIQKAGYRPYRAVIATKTGETVEHTVRLTPQ